MEQKRTTKEYKREIFQKARCEAEEFLGSKGEFVKVLIQILLVLIALALLAMLAYFGLFKNAEKVYDSVFNIVLGLLIGDVALLLLFYVSIPIIARYNMWGVAFRNDEEQKRDIQEQQDFVAYLKDLERKANGDLIKLNKVEGNNWMGVEIFNGEKGNPFHGRLFVTDATGYVLGNSIELLNSDTQNTSFEALSDQKATMKLISWSGNNAVPSLFTRVSNRYQFSGQGEYTIRTLMVGTFWSSSLTAVEIKNEWKFTVNKDNTYNLEKISEERVNRAQ